LPQGWDNYWKNDDTKLVHFLGKDNIVFHCIIFPAMLKAHGGYILPDNVPANEFLNIEGEKVSTSRNWAVWIDEYLQDFPDMQDALRYVLCANAPETKDNDFTWKDFQERNNNELVAKLGNFVHRSMIMMHKFCGGKVPKFHDEEKNNSDLELIKDIQNAKSKIQNCIEHYKFRDALFEVIELARKGNVYLQDAAPWMLGKTPELQAENQKKIDNCIHITLQLTANLAVFINPFLPFTAQKICQMLTVVGKMLEWENGGRMDLVKENYPLRAPELLFRKIEDAEMEAQKEKLIAKSQVAQQAIKPKEAQQNDNKKTITLKPQITIDDFAKVELRSGIILSAEKVEQADKLLKLAIDLGFEQRTIVSGIAQHYKPEDIIGKQVTVVVNLAPRKMKGIESAGMILMAEDANGKLVFVAPTENTHAGNEVR
jgi:methionyl-tRNA synthetase